MRAKASSALDTSTVCSVEELSPEPEGREGGTCKGLFLPSWSTASTELSPPNSTGHALALSMFPLTLPCSIEATKTKLDDDYTSDQSLVHLTMSRRCHRS